MPAKFHLFSPTAWDRTMRELSGPAKVVRMYVMTCPNRISEGLYQLAVGIIVHDTGLSEKHVRQGLAELEAAGLVSYDEQAEVVLDRTALKLSPLKHGRPDPETGEVKRNRAMVNAIRLFEQAPDTWLKREQYRLAKLYSPDFAQDLSSHMPELELEPGDSPFPERNPYPSSNGGSHGGSREDASQIGEERSAIPPCAACGNAAITSGGEVQVNDDGKPWCGWCERSLLSQVPARPPIPDHP